MMTRKLRQTELKALRIERSYIDILGLEAILAIPKALGPPPPPGPSAVTEYASQYRDGYGPFALVSVSLTMIV